ncbi:hypothetical protein ACIBHX_14915 [Nonomuraea sp. NPDC050536]
MSDVRQAEVTPPAAPGSRPCENGKQSDGAARRNEVTETVEVVFKEWDS